MKVTAILKGRVDREGRYPVQIRIASGDNRTFLPTKIRIHPAQFKDGKVVNHSKAKRLNAIIHDLLIECESSGIAGKKSFPGGDYLEYCLQTISQREKTKEPETIRQNRSELNKSSKFFGKIDLLKITPAVLERYVDYCYSLGNEGNTVWKSLKFVRLIILKAKKEKLIGDNPFDVFEMPKYRDPKRNYLTTDQIAIIENYRGDHLLTATWFVICCYTGLRFQDAVNFNKKRDVKEGRLVIQTMKTKETIGMPMSAKLKELFGRIDYKPLPYSNKHSNAVIRAVAAEVGIEDYVNWHLSRHTAAVRWADAGISIEVTAKLLGQKNIKTTQIYYKITNKRIDEELSKL